MSRLPTDSLLARIDAEIIDNDIGLVTPAVVRQAIKDAIESLRPAWSALDADHTTSGVTVALTTAWKVLGGAGFWTFGAASNVAEFNYDQTTGLLVPIYIGYNHILRGLINFEGSQGDEYQVSIGVNGAPVGVVSSIDGAGTGRIVSTTDWALNFPQANENYQLLMRRGTGSGNVTIRQAQLFGELVTTRYL